MTRRSPSEFTYMRNVAQYGVRYFDCPSCGAKPHEACTQAEAGKIACTARWVIAREEFADPARRRPYERDTVGARQRAAAAAAAAAVRVPLADPQASPAWRYRKLRQFLAPRGVILVKVRGAERYQIVKDGRVIKDSITLATAEHWIVNYWEFSDKYVAR